MNTEFNSQQEWINQMNYLSNILKNDTFVLEAQRAQDRIWGENYQNVIAHLQPISDLSIPDDVIQSANYIRNVVGQGHVYDGAIHEIAQYAMRFEGIINGFQNMLNVVSINQEIINSINNFHIISFYPNNISREEKKETEEVSNKIISEILKPEKKKIQTEDAAIIKVLPVNERLLQYLAENPNDWYNLKPRQFEQAMAEIYTKLGYKVKITPETRDGGKDLIIIDNRGLGDLMYYVECKHYKPESHVGIGFIQRLHGVVNSDRVNGGILATTSFFSKPARDFVLENKLECQIKLQDYNNIQDLLKMAVG